MLSSTCIIAAADLKTWLKITPGQSKSVSSLVRVGDLATARVVNHGFRNGDTVAIAGADQAPYDGSVTINLLDGDHFSYPVIGAPATPATGVITAVSDQDALVNLIANRISADLERATSRIFKKREDLVDTRDGNNLRTMYLERYPVIELTSLTVNGAAVAVGTDVMLSRDSGRLKWANTFGVFASGVNNVIATYDAGYEDDNLPSDAIGVALEMAAFLYDRWKTGALATTNINVGSSGVSFVQSYPRELRIAIEQLKDVRA